MLRVPLILALALLPVWAQTQAAKQPKAPAGVEEALRTRVNEFYQLQVDGKFRAAEKYVCESSQEAYYASDKSRWLSKQITRVEFKDKFTKADVYVAFESEASTPFGSIRMKSVIPSPWNFEKGAWCHFMPDPSSVVSRVTPFGTMMAKAPTPDTPAGPPQGKEMAAATVQSSVAAKRTTLHVKSGEASSDETEILNGLDGMIDLRLKDPNLPGLTVTLSPQRLKSKEKAMVKVSYAPQERSTRSACEIPIEVIPTGQRIVLSLQFDAQAEAPGKAPPDLGTKNEK